MYINCGKNILSFGYNNQPFITSKTGITNVIFVSGVYFIQISKSWIFVYKFEKMKIFVMIFTYDLCVKYDA